VDYARQLLAGLASLHAAGMVHRDVKPANCLFVEGKLKLADFGLLTEAHPLVSRVGTQKYMPPDGRMDMRADVYAAGLVIYQMITGLPVDEFPRLGHRAGEIAADRTLTSLLGLVLQACEREPERRFADARPMLAALDAPAKIAHRPPRRRTFVAACAVVFMGVVWGTWMTVPRRVAVSFITDPYEAHVFLDNSLQVDPEGVPYRTPCTIEDIPSGTHRVAFEREGVPRWEDGEHDFAQTRQIVSRRTP
jgi:serine/threonine protein kinase